jgi:hypothetical protein
MALNEIDDVQLGELFDRIHAMSEQDRLDLDPIARALGIYQAKYHAERGWRISPNRVVALAAVDLLNAWEKHEWERE